MQITVVKNKIISFLFELKLDINKSINNGYILNDIQCLNYIKARVIESDCFELDSNEALINVTEQIFIYFFDESILDLPLSYHIKDLSLLN